MEKSIAISANVCILADVSGSPNSTLPPNGPELFGPVFCFSLKGRNAFSLVEVTLALGLVSFAFVAILGLLPTGLTSLRDSMNQTVEAQILRSISSQCVVSDFNHLSTNGLYFNDEGLPSTASSSFFSVKVTTNAPIYPGSAKGERLAESITTLRVEMVSKQGPDATSGRTNYYTLHVANSGK